MYMMDITINYKNAVDFMDNKHIMKMILHHSIENNSDAFNGMMIFKKTKLYDKFQNNFQFALITKGKAKKIIGFILEKTYFEKKVWTMDSIYITPNERMKGYCMETLLQYSKLQRAIIASPTIMNILFKINMRYSIDMDDLVYRPNMDINNIKKTLVNKDYTMNFLTKALVDYYCI